MTVPVSFLLRRIRTRSRPRPSSPTINCPSFQLGEKKSWKPSTRSGQHPDHNIITPTIGICEYGRDRKKGSSFLSGNNLHNEVSSLPYIGRASFTCLLSRVSNSKVVNLLTRFFASRFLRDVFSTCISGKRLKVIFHPPDMGT